MTIRSFPPARRTTPSGYRHGLRVRMGSPSGPRGVLLECESRQPGGGKYWKVRLQTGEWIWPTDAGGLLVDGAGDAIGTCASCDLRFILPAGSGELLCARCDHEQFGRDRERAAETPPAKRWNTHRRWIKRDRS